MNPHTSLTGRAARRFSLVSRPLIRSIGYCIWLLVAWFSTGLLADSVFVCDYSGFKMHEFSTSGRLIAQRKFAYPPVSIAADHAGHVYVVTLDGKLLKIAPSGSAKSLRYRNHGRFDSFGAMAADPQGRLWVVNGGGNTLERFSAAGVHEGTFSYDGLSNSNAMTVSAEGTLYVANLIGIAKFNASGVYQGVVIPGLYQVRHLGCDPQGRIYLEYAGKIHRYSSTGTNLGVFATPQGSIAALHVDRHGKVWTLNYAGLLEAFDNSGIRVAATRLEGITVAFGLVVVRSNHTQAGQYFGHFDDATGAVRLTFTSMGKFSGKVHSTSGKPVSVRGALAGNGSYSGPVGNTGAVLELTFSQGNGAPGSFSCTGRYAGKPFTVLREIYAGKPVPEKGSYTILMDSGRVASNLPQGFSYATASVDARGTFKATGRLADGQTFMLSSPLVNQADSQVRLDLFQETLYKKAGGSLSGSVLFDNFNNADAYGSVRWQRPNSGGALTAVFDAEMPTWISQYSKPSRTQGILPDGKYTLLLESGGLAQPMEQAFQLSAPAKLTPLGNNPARLKASFNPGTGVFSGSFLHPVSSKSVRFQGVAYPHPGDSLAAGYFIKPPGQNLNDIGYVLLVPKP